MASEGNTTEFGDLTEKMSEQMGGCANSVRCTFAGGNNPGCKNPLNTISFVTIASAGNAKILEIYPTNGKKRLNILHSIPARPMVD